MQSKGSTYAYANVESSIFGSLGVTEDNTHPGNGARASAHYFIPKGDTLMYFNTSGANFYIAEFYPFKV